MKPQPLGVMRGSAAASSQPLSIFNLAGVQSGSAGSEAGGGEKSEGKSDARMFFN